MRTAKTPMVLGYRPSEPTGWPAPAPGVGATVGGHVEAEDFTAGGRSYRVELLSFGGAGTPPVYRRLPAAHFTRTLADAFGADYEVRYAGGLRGSALFEVRSYSVWVEEAPAGAFCGADLYVEYGAGPHRAGPVLRWIQVVRQTGRPAYVDNRGRANPFYVTGGRTSVYGRSVVNFAYRDGRPPDPAGEASYRFTAEAFLVEDAGARDGRGVVTVLGGFRYGWQVREVAP